MNSRTNTNRFTIAVAVSAALALGQIAVAGEGINAHTRNAVYSAAPFHMVEFAVEIPERVSMPLGQTDGENGIVYRIAGAVLNFMVPKAHGADVPVFSTFPRLIFDDIDRVGEEFAIEVNDGIEPFWGILDAYQGHHWFQYSGSAVLGAADTENSIVINAAGDITLADSAFIFERAANRLGIGTTAPFVNFQINDVIPEIRLVDDSDNGTMDIQYDLDVLRFEGNTGQAILTLSETAPTGSVFVAANGDVGLGTTTPLQDLHVSGGQILLDEDGGGAGGPSDWLVNPGSTGLWFVNQDGTDTTPVKFANDAPDNSLVMRSLSGYIGIGTETPGTKLEVTSTSGDARMSIDENSASATKRFLLELENNGAAGFFFRDSSTGDEWQFAGTATGEFTASYLGTGGSEMIVRKTGEFQVGPGGSSKFRVTPTGSGFFAGPVQATAFTQSSDRNKKQNFREIDPKTVLAKVNALDISRWNFKQHDSEADHIGPMAQDFYKSFGLGSDDKHISPLDMASVALAAIKGQQAELSSLKSELATRDVEIASLRDQLTAQSAKIVSLSDQQKRVDQLEASLKTLLDVMPQTGSMPVALKQGTVIAY